MFRLCAAAGSLVSPQVLLSCLLKSFRIKCTLNCHKTNIDNVKAAIKQLTDSCWAVVGQLSGSLPSAIRQLSVAVVSQFLARYWLVFCQLSSSFPPVVK